MTRVSACLITRDDPHLPKAVASVRPHVDEVCIVDTGSVDKGALAQSLADHFVYTTEFNFAKDDPRTAWGGYAGKIKDFAGARNLSFSLATNPWLVWLDSDDEVVGAEKLRAIAKEHEGDGAQGIRILFPYEYLYDGNGACTQLALRERLIFRKDLFTWHRRVHETVVAIDGDKIRDHGDERVMWKHRRARRPASEVDRYRNLRILLEYATNSEDPREQYDLGVELQQAGSHHAALVHLEKCFDTSGWADERWLAAKRCSDIHAFYSNIEEAKVWARKCIQVRPQWGESYFLLAHLEYSDGVEEDRPDWKAHLERAATFAQAGLARPKTKTALAMDPTQREHEIHLLLADCARRLGDWDAAIGHVDAALTERPKDPGLHLVRRDVVRKAGKQPKDERRHVLFLCPPTPEPWDPESVKATGIGGSETAVIEVARRLAAKSWRVTVMNHCARPGLFGGVEYRPIQEQHDPGVPDVLVAWRDARILECPARARVLWAHDLGVANFSYGRSLLADKILGVSEWHRRDLMQRYALHPGHVLATRNGIDVSRFEGEAPARDPHKVVYTSSADRGLGVLLEMWPTIRRRVHDATLHVFYGMETWRHSAEARGDESQRFLIHTLDRRMKELEPLGVHYRGRVDQKTLAREMQSAGVWALPGWFAETSCIGAMEAQAAGCFIVASDRAALRETCAGADLPVKTPMLLSGDWLSDDYRAAFTDAVVDRLFFGSDVGRLYFTSGMHEPPEAHRKRIASAARARFSWEGVAEQWDILLTELLQAADDGVVPPYQPLMTRAA